MATMKMKSCVWGGCVGGVLERFNNKSVLCVVVLLYKQCDGFTVKH